MGIQEIQANSDTIAAMPNGAESMNLLCLVCNIQFALANLRETMITHNAIRLMNLSSLWHNTRMGFAKMGLVCGKFYESILPCIKQNALYKSPLYESLLYESFLHRKKLRSKAYSPRTHESLYAYKSLRNAA